MNLIHTLSSVIIPKSLGMERNLPRRADPTTQSTDAAWRNYDRRTLMYDAVHLSDAALVRLYLPRLLNFSRIMLGSRFVIDDKTVHPKPHKIYRRFETVDFKVGVDTPRLLEIFMPSGEQFQVCINSARPTLFQDCRVIYTMLKDEKLEWVQDWLQFHNRVHGADAVLIADNGSSRYSSTQLLAALEEVPGYRERSILSVPLPWGPIGNASGVDDGKYLQTTLLNLSRDRFLSSAHGVLNLDVDELLLRRGKDSVFDRVQRWGLVTFPGEWRYPTNTEGNPTHRDHLYRDPNDKPCARKYCFRPSSRLGRMCLSVHGLEKLNRKLFSGKRDFMFLHCRNISTSWKSDRSMAANSAMSIDAETADALTAAYLK
jgi:hypothetical protein